jgi:hypothetical protein
MEEPTSETCTYIEVKYSMYLRGIECDLDAAAPKIIPTGGMCEHKDLRKL